MIFRFSGHTGPGEENADDGRGNRPTKQWQADTTPSGCQLQQWRSGRNVWDGGIPGGAGRGRLCSGRGWKLTLALCARQDRQVSQNLGGHNHNRNHNSLSFDIEVLQWFVVRFFQKRGPGHWHFNDNSNSMLESLTSFYKCVYQQVCMYLWILRKLLIWSHGHLSTKL